MWEILSHKLVTDEDAICEIIQAAANCANEAAMISHETELINSLCK